MASKRAAEDDMQKETGKTRRTSSTQPPQTRAVLDPEGDILLRLGGLEKKQESTTGAVQLDLLVSSEILKFASPSLQTGFSSLISQRAAQSKNMLPRER